MRADVRTDRTAGMTLVEVMIGLTVASIVFWGAAALISGGLRPIVDAGRRVEAVLDTVQAQREVLRRANQATIDPSAPEVSVPPGIAVRSLVEP